MKINNRYPWIKLLFSVFLFASPAKAAGQAWVAEVRFTVFALTQASAYVEKLSDLSRNIFSINFPLPETMPMPLQNEIFNDTLGLPSFIVSMSRVQSLLTKSQPLALSWD